MGFDNDSIVNIHSLPPEYFCPVCRALVYPNEALQSQCFHLYCKPCLSYVLRTTNVCPYDGFLVTEGSSKVLVESDKALAARIGNILMRCLFHRSGCSWHGPLSQCTRHCSGCYFRNSPVVCNTRGMQLVHRQVQEHAQYCVDSNPQRLVAQPSQAANAPPSAQPSQAPSAPPSAQPSQAVNAPPSAHNANFGVQTNTSAAWRTTDQLNPQPFQKYNQQYPAYDPFQQSYQQYYPCQQQTAQRLPQAPHVAGQSHVYGQHSAGIRRHHQPLQQGQCQSHANTQPQISMAGRGERRNDYRNSKHEDNIYRYYRDLKDGRDRVKVSDRIYECPYCPIYEKKEYTYLQILKHASRIGTESKTSSSRSRERHLGLEMYLKRCFDRTDKTSLSRTEHYKNDNSQKQIALPSLTIDSVDKNIVVARRTECYENDNGQKQITVLPVPTESSRRLLKHDPPSHTHKREAEHMKPEAIEELLVYPWMVVIANIPVELMKDGTYVGDNGRKLRDEWTVQGYQPTKVHTLWNRKGHTGFATVKFKNDWTGYSNAMRFAHKFETDFHGKKHWQKARDKGDSLYAWIASEEDYKRSDAMGEYLRKTADLKTISDIIKEVKRKEASLVCNITNSLDMKEKQCAEIKENIEKTEASFLNVMTQKENMVKHFNEELEMRQKQQCKEFESIYRAHEQTKVMLEAKREELRLYEKGLRERAYLNETERRRLDHLKKTDKKNEEAIIEQSRVEERMLKLAEDHKKERHQLYQRFIELQKKRQEKQRLELEIEQLKGAVEVRKCVSDGGDAEVKKKMESLEESLKEKTEDLEDLDALSQALIVKQRKANDELQDARKELINGLKDRHSVNASIGVKRMGDLNHKPIVSAAKVKYPAAEAGVKAMEFSSLLDSKIRDSNWYPFKVITVGADSKRVIDEEDDCIKVIKNEWGDEVYDTVVTALTELNEYNQSGRYPVAELWNFKEGRKATLGESVDFILRLWKTHKRKRN